MTYSAGRQPPGWYHAHGDPPRTQRYWDGTGWIGTPRPAPGRTGSDDMELALPLPRIAARIVDCALWAVMLLASIWLIAALGDGGADGGWRRRAVAVVVFAVLVVVYETLFVGRMDGTLGKLALGLRVRHRDGGEADAAAGVRRALPLLIFAVAGGLVVLSPWWLATLGVVAASALLVGGLIPVLTDRLRQAPWDRLGDTIVVATGSGSMRGHDDSRMQGDEHAEAADADEPLDVPDGVGDDERP